LTWLTWLSWLLTWLTDLVELVLLRVPGGVHPPVHPPCTPLGTPPPAEQGRTRTAGTALTCANGPYRHGLIPDSCNNVPRPEMPVKSILNLTFPAFGHVGIQWCNQLLFVLDRDLLISITLPKTQVVRS